jgi:hypothetical protein
MGLFNFKGNQMNSQIAAFIEELKANQKLATFDEASMKQAVILRLLSFLGWDIFNVEEVYPDYSLNSQSLDYALRIRNANKVFIEVKAPNEKLDNHQKKLLSLNFLQTADMAILTNGVSWWFYLCAGDGNPEQKRFFAADLLKQNANAIVSRFIDFLGHQNVASGEFLKAAQAYFHSQKQRIAADAVPVAWNKIISEPNKIFVELLSETTEKLCGYKADSKLVEKFLQKNLKQCLIRDVVSAGDLLAAKALARPSSEDRPIELANEIVTPPKGSASDVSSPPKGTASDVSPQPKGTASDVSPQPKGNASDVPSKQKGNASDVYRDKQIKSFSFNGQTYHVSTWVEMLATLCNHFASLHRKDFEKVLWISPNQKRLFSRYSDQLRLPEQIDQTDIFVETKLTSEEIVRAAKALLTEFGHDKNDLIITVE